MITNFNGVLVCATKDNHQELTVLLHSLAKHYDGKIIVAFSQQLADSVAAATLSIENNIEYFEFSQASNEQGLVAKSMQKAYDLGVNKMIYIASHCLVTKPLTPLLDVSLGTCLFGGLPEYIYRKNENAEEAYREHDPKFAPRVNLAGNAYINTDVLLINMPVIRRSNIEIDTLYKKFYEKKYYIELSLCEFINELSVGHNKLLLPLEIHHCGDRHLYKGKSHTMCLRTQSVIKKSMIINFKRAKPWLNWSLNRESLQYPVAIYNEFITENDVPVSVSFIDRVRANAEKWETLLGPLPEAVAQYFGD